KTTLSDRLLQHTGTISDREMQGQSLDSMDLERERGITIKAHPVTMLYLAKNGETYELNLIDTPGHVDFSYEVSRSLSACEGALQALSFDSYFDTYKGVVIHVRVFNGELKAGMLVKLLHSGKTVEVKETGSFNPKPYVRERLETGETGYITANIKSPLDVKLGDTLTDSRIPSPALAGFREVHPMVFSGIYPINTADYEHLKANLAKLQLNDSAFV